MSRYFSLVLVMLVISGCAKNIDPNTYTEQQVGKAAATYQAVVVSSRPVIVKGADKLENNGLGIIIGGVAGGLGGNQFGAGSGRTAATVGAVVVGAALGALAQDALGEQNGTEYIVKYWDAEAGTVQKRTFAGASCTHGRTECVAEERTAIANERLITMVLGSEPSLQVGQRAFLIITPSGRSRLVPDVSGSPLVNQPAIDAAR